MLSRRLRPYSLLLLLAAAPRAAVLVVLDARILEDRVEKSWIFAHTFTGSGTFGFIPGEPSASTQPFYAWFLIPIARVFGDLGWAIGLAQTGVAVATACVVYEIGRRFMTDRLALLAAAASTLQPYLIWHDVHVNREILDQLLGVALVLLALVAAERRSRRSAAALGVVAGLAMLANTRLVLLPAVLAGYLLMRVRPRRLGAAAAACVLGAAAVTIAPWVARNAVVIGCPTITTDARALWKANNPNTHATLAAGSFIDDVPPLPGIPLTPHQAWGLWQSTGRVEHVDECAQMRFYERQVAWFWVHHPREKAALVVQATRMLWSPFVRSDVAVQAEGSSTARRLVEPVYMIVLFGLAAVGMFALPRAVAGLFVAFLAYETLAAAIFAGTTRYRVAWDFVIALAAARGLALLAQRVRLRVVSTGAARSS